MMRQRIWEKIVMIAAVVLMLSNSCTKDENSTNPVVATFLVSEISATSVVCGGEITSDGGSAITSRGVCWGTVKHPLTTGNHTSDSTGTGIFTSSVTGLSASTKYFVRAYAANLNNTAYGYEMVFTTINTEKISDIEGSVYNTITLGTQTWMTDDLKTSHYNDGTAIPHVTNANEWKVLTTPAYCWYDNDSLTNKPAYGALYNWYTVNTGKLCPPGWHVPSDSEWKTLEMYLGMSQAEADETAFRGTSQGIQLRSVYGWNSRGNSSNSSGFSGLPAGARKIDGSFEALGNGNNWWSSSAANTFSAWKRGMYYPYGGVFRGFYEKSNGYSVRCLRDN